MGIKSWLWLLARAIFFLVRKGATEGAIYSERVILRNIEEFSAGEGWCPVYHTYDEIRNFTAYINSLTTVESNTKSSYYSLNKSITAKRQKEIARWIENEQALCGMDSAYWENNYAWVCDEKGQIFKFRNRRSQDVFDAIIAEFDEREVSIELLILKARQVGISTKTALKFIHRLMFIPHTQAIMASVQKEKSELIGRILDTAYNRSPWWLVPRRMPKRSFDNGSILSVQSGMQATGLAQGWTPSCLVPDTPIRLADGRIEPISRVKSGEQSLTHCGHKATIKRAWCTSRQGEPTKIIKFWGNYESLECTLDHLIFAYTVGVGGQCEPDWVEAAELRPGDYVTIPVRKIVSDLTTTEMTCLPRGAVRANRIQALAFPLTPDLGYLCGFYLAEGNCHKGALGHKTKKPYYSEIVFSIHKSEVERTVAAVKAVLGREQHVGVRPKKGNGAYVSVSCAWLTRWMADNFGTLTGKVVPDWAWRAGNKFCEQILKGYLDGDGHCVPDANLVIAPCVCRAIVMQMRDLVASLGFGWASIYHRDAYCDKDGQRHSECWKLALSGPCGHRYRKHFGLTEHPTHGEGRHWHYADAGIYVEIESVKDGFSDEFWDMEIDHPAHSFLTAQCAVHNCVHISELADIPNPNVTIEEGLFRAAHSSRNLFMVLEGTGGGNTGWLADTWRSSKEDWPKGLARLCPVFIPWAMCPDIYPEPDWVRKFPLPDDWHRKMHAITRKHVIKCESYIRNTPYLARIAGRDWKMPEEQKWFWQFNYDAACKNHTQKTWAAQMPADDYEALTGIHDSVFDPEVLMEVEDRIYEIRTSDNKRVRKQAVAAYAITGHDVDEAFYPSDDRIDWSKDVVRVEWDSHRGQHYDWNMVPLLLEDEEKERSTMDCLLVFEWPKNGHYYSCGVDTADGLGKEDEERTCLSVAKNRFQGDCDQQVAELTSNKINSAQVVAFAACIGALYGPSCPNNRGVKYCIEQIQGPGDTCQHQLKMMGFFNHHIPRRYDSKKIKDDSTKKEGWYSNVWSVPMLMTRFVEAVNGGWYEPRSKWLIEELRTLERHETSGKSKMEHRSGKFDDRARAAAQSFFTAHDMDVLAERAQKRYALPVKKKPFSKARCTASEVSVGVW